MKQTAPIEKRIWNEETRSFWARGPWDDEPDEVLWTDSESGYHCVIARSDMGTLCGYVGVDSKHPAYGKERDEGQCRDLDAHGGITFTSGHDPSLSKHDGKPVEGLWWFGFDCMHLNYDVSPAERGIVNFFRQLKDVPEVNKKELNSAISGLERMHKGWKSTYRDIPYVKTQINKLVMQLMAYKLIES